MAMKAFLVLALVMILGSFAVSNVRRLDSPQLEQTLLRAATGDSEAAAILRATVRIRLVAPYLDGRGNRVLMHDSGRPMGLDAINHGLGTLVVVDGRTLVVTHDHYSEIDTAVAEAIVTDYSGREVALPSPSSASSFATATTASSCWKRRVGCRRARRWAMGWRSRRAAWPGSSTAIRRRMPCRW